MISLKVCAFQGVGSWLLALNVVLMVVPKGACTGHQACQELHKNAAETCSLTHSVCAASVIILNRGGAGASNPACEPSTLH